MINYIKKNVQSLHGGTYSLEELVYFDGTVSYIVHYSEQGNDLYIITSSTPFANEIEEAIKKYLDFVSKESSILART